jgi:hypothetical protein
MAHDERDRRRDAAGIGPYARDAERLVRLHDMGAWNVAEGEPDIRGWEVRTIGGRELGKITELLIDPDAGEVVMLDVDLSGAHRRDRPPSPCCAHGLRRHYACRIRRLGRSGDE